VTGARRCGAPLAIAAVFLALVAGAGAGPAVLPQQSGAVDLLEPAHLRIDGQQAVDTVGEVVSGAGDVNGDGRADMLVSVDFAHNNGRSGSGSVYVVFGRASTTRIDLTAIDANGFRIDGAGQNDFAGTSVSGAGDVNGDGRADVLVGATGTNHNGSDSGSAYLVFGKSSNTTVDLAALGNDGFRIDGVGPTDRVGTSVSGAGDVNGDGRPDLLVGARQAHLSDEGAAYVVFGKSSTTPVDLGALGDGGFRIEGFDANGFVGSAVAGPGDVNGDGRPDLLVGAPGAHGDADSLVSGAAFVVFGKASSTAVDLGALGADDGFKIGGVSFGDGTGGAVSGARDVNGDGLMDVLVGADQADPGGHDLAGSAYVVFGKTTPTPVDLDALGSGGFRIDGSSALQRVGASVSDAGDVNGDGRADVVVGARSSDSNGRSDSGSAYVVFGKTSTTTVDLATLGSAGIRIDGASAGDHAGTDVSGPTDVNGDRRPDVLVGAPGADPLGRSEAGSAYVVLGFGVPRLAYGPAVQATVGRALQRQAPTQFEHTGTPVFGASPPLPAGLSFDAGGAVTGTPLVGQVQTTHVVTMHDLAGAVSAPLVVTVADATAPRLTLRASSPQRALRQKRILVRVRCNEACTLRATGSITIRGVRAVIPLRAAAANRASTRERRLALALTKAARKRLAGFLAKGRKAKAIVSIQARDRAGNTKTNTRGIIVRL
jgi:FG-GAP repeat